MPLASAPDIFQGGLFVLAVLAALYGAREIVLPIVLAAMLSSCCNRRCEPCSGSTCREPLGALLLIGVSFCTLIAFGTALSGPAVSWAQKLPEGAPRLQEHLSFLDRKSVV